MKIVKAAKKDIPSLIKLIINADNREIIWAKDRANRFILNKKKDRLILIAKDKNKIIGYLGIKKYEDNPAREFINPDDYIWVTWIALLPEYRHKGIGSILLSSSERYVKKFNKRGILLDCREKIIPFYKKNNYSILGKYNDKGVLRYVMGKEIK